MVSTIVEADDVELYRVKGGPGTGGDLGGEAWVVKANGVRAGTIHINLGKDGRATIGIFLNKPSQGRHIGRYAYQLACSDSSYDTIYAHIRKSNITSRKAAEYAGFVDVTKPTDSQIVMVWHR